MNFKKIVLFFGVTLTLVSAQAQTSGKLMVNPDHSQAVLTLTETSSAGQLSQLFDQMKITQTGTVQSRIKAINHSSGQFSVYCQKNVLAGAPPTTQCTWVIKTGVDTDQVRAVIMVAGAKKIALLEFAFTSAQEIVGLFPTVPSGVFVMNVPGGISLRVTGANTKSVAIQFSEN